MFLGNHYFGIMQIPSLAIYFETLRSSKKLKSEVATRSNLVSVLVAKRGVSAKLWDDSFGYWRT